MFDSGEGTVLSPTEIPSTTAPPAPTMPIHVNGRGQWLAIAVAFLILIGIFVQNIVGPVGNVIQPGRPAPVFTLKTVDGQTVALQSLRGKPVLVNFFATWCVPCQTELPAIQSAWQQSHGAYQVLLVDVNEDSGTVTPYLRQHHLTLPVVLDANSTVTDLYQASGLPTTYFIDAQGVIRASHLGPMSASDITSGLKAAGA